MKEILKFEADWCGPCQTMKPIMKNVAKNNPNIHVTTVNLDDPATDTQKSGTEKAFTYNVLQIPTLIFLEDGVEMDRVTGVQTEDALKSKIESAFS